MGRLDRQCKNCGNQYIDIRYAKLEWCKLCNINYFKNNFTNWTSGNKKIDGYIQEMQLSNDNHDEIVFEWIPYDQFNSIKEIGKDGFDTLYSAMWKDGPLCYEKEWIRKMDKKVVLKCLHNSQNFINEFTDKVKSYSTKDYYDQTNALIIHGISQNPDTKDYIIVLQDGYCEICGKQYTNTTDKWCKSCLINYLKKNLANWTSGNGKIDYCIQKLQLKIDDCNDMVFEWVPYDQFSDIKEIDKDGFDMVYVAVWKDGPLHYCNDKIIRNQNKKVVLKCLYNSQNNINEFLNKVEEYVIQNYGSHNCNNFFKIHGISQNPDTKDYIIVFQDGYYCEKCGKEYVNAYRWCGPCQISDLKANFTNWTSRNEKIDNLIQEMQLKIKPSDIVFGWIPYNEFNDIKEIAKDDFSKVYSAIWKDGPLYYDYFYKKEYTRDQNKKVALKCLCNSSNTINEFLNQVKECLMSKDFNVYGISQNPNTKDYIIVLQDKYCEKCGKQYIDKWCKPCQLNELKKNFTNWSSGNEKINCLIQESQLKIDEQIDIVLEWIPYNQFNNIKEIGKSGLATAIWKDGPLYYNDNKKEFTRKFINYKVALKWLHISKNTINEFLNEVKAYLVENFRDDGCEYFFISNEVMLHEDLENNENNEILEQQGKEDDFNIISEQHDMAIESKEEYSNDNIKIYGISQNPDTKVYIMVLQNGYCEKCGEKYINRYELEWCKPCLINDLKKNLTNWSENDSINNLIQEIQLKIDDCCDTVFEWIPYNQFNDIKKIGEGGFATVYSATWRDGLLYYHDKKYTRKSNKKVALKCLHNSRNITKEFLNEIKAYTVDNLWNNILPIYGISQNSDTKEYIMVLKYAKDGNLKDWVNKNYKEFSWASKIDALFSIIMGLNEIHKKQMVHRDFHTGNILLDVLSLRMSDSGIYISDMGLCGKVDNTDKTKIYGVIPYVAPEVLKGEPYTQAADIYSFGMVMYFVATGKQPFANYAHDQYLSLKICDGIRPEINGPEAPKYYIDLMKRCWNSNPKNRPNATKVLNLFELFQDSQGKSYELQKEQYHYKIEMQFKEAEKYRKSHLSSLEKNRQQTTHPEAIYNSRLLNNYTENLSKHDNDDFNDFDDFNDDDDDDSLWTLSSNCFD